MMGTYPALSSGVTQTTVLHDGSMMNTPWNADPVTVEACLSTADCTPGGSGWIAATNTAGGHWTVDFTGLASGSNTVYVRLFVGKDGGALEQKTTNGMAYDGTNGYQTFTLTPGSMSMKPKTR